LSRKHKDIRDEMDSLRILRYHRLESLCTPIPIHYNGQYVANYFPDGYYVIDFFFNTKSLEGKNVGSIISPLYGMCTNLFIINGIDAYDSIFRYMELLCELFIDREDGLMFSRMTLSDIVNNSLQKVESGEITADDVKRLRKWEWKGSFAFLTKNEKSSIMMSRTNRKTSEDSAVKIEMAVNEMIEEPIFITIKELAERCNLSEDSVYRYIDDHSEVIDSHNLSLFSTINFNEYVREVNTLAVIEVLKMAIEYNKKIQKTTLADTCNISRATLYRIWGDPRIKKIVNEYNELPLHKLNSNKNGKTKKSSVIVCN